MSNTLPMTDAESEAYLQRYPDVRALIPFYGANAARAHYDVYGKGEGRTWGAATPTPAAPAAPVKTAATEPQPAMYDNDAASWDAYLKSARSAAEGINQMPGVFSDYGNVPIEDAAARALFYPQSSPATASQAPQAMSALASLTGMGQDAMMSQPVGALSPSQQFARIMDMGQGAFETPVHQMVDQRGGSISPEELAFYVKGREQWGL